MNKSSDFFIIKTSALGVNDKYLLKLNREKKKLEVYHKVENDRINDYYSIRADFDSSQYTMYKIESSLPCLYGGNESPTPYGIFQIEKKSNDEYATPYRKGYDGVKFFGYFVVFDDYFIHSHMYEVDVTKDTMNHTRSISLEDDHTFGCIRLLQKDLEMLLSKIEIGTTVIL